MFSSFCPLSLSLSLLVPSLEPNLTQRPISSAYILRGAVRKTVRSVCFGRAKLKSLTFMCLMRRSFGLSQCHLPVHLLIISRKRSHFKRKCDFSNEPTVRLRSKFGEPKQTNEINKAIFCFGPSNYGQIMACTISAGQFNAPVL